MVDIGRLRALQSDMASLADELGLVTKLLEDDELTRFGRAFERQFLIPYAERQIVDIYLRHQGECLLGAMVAKEQMDADIQGEQPGSNMVAGPVPIRACFLGVGGDWEDILGIYGGTQGYWTTGSAQNWIHSGTTLMGGSSGNAVKIGENAVHVVIAVQDYHPSPKLESVQFTIDGKEKPILECFYPHKRFESLRIKELDNAYVFKRDTTVLAKVFISGAFGAAVTNVVCYPQLLGVSYIKEPIQRTLDPVSAATWVGTVKEVIHTT